MFLPPGVSPLPAVQRPPGVPRPPPPRIGGVLTGTVKSYNAKGFGFILSESVEHDVYFSRESLQQGLRTANIAGTVVSFELARGPGGKPLARNLRPVHGVPPNFFNARGGSSSIPPPFTSGPCLGSLGKGGVGLQPPPPPGGPPPLGGPPLVAPAPFRPGPPRTLSPHAGSRAMMGLRKEEAKGTKESSDSSSGSHSSPKRKSGAASGSSASSSKQKRKKKKKKRRRSRSGSQGSQASKKKRRKRKSSSSSSSSSSKGRADAEPSGAADAAGAEGEGNKEVEDAKRDALKKLQELQGITNKDARMKEWRALLRMWHPDKNPENVEVATAVFQFLQKGKVLLDGT